MNRTELKDILQEKFFDVNNRIVGSRTKEFSAMKILGEELFNLLIELTKFLNNDSKISHRIFCVMNNIVDNPKCDYCKEKNTRFIKYSDGYTKYCSSYCVNHSPEVLETRVNNNLEKYGVISPTQLDTVKAKNKESMINKYGDNYSSLLLEKRKKTLIEKYGVDNASKIDAVKIKREQTNTDRYGYKSNLLDPNVRKQINETILEKYGVKNASQNSEIKERKLKKGNETYLSGGNINVKLAIEKYNNIIIKNNLESEVTFNRGVYSVLCHKCGNTTIDTPEFIYNRIVLLGNTACTHCAPRCSGGSSFVERNFAEFIGKIYKGELINNIRSIIGLELDIYLPELKMAVEIHGLYWHSDEYRDKTYHYRKLKLCQEKGIQLYQFFEDEIPQAMMLMYSVLANKGALRNDINLDDINTEYGLSLQPMAKIYARKTIVKRIPEADKNIAKEIMEAYHIQGGDSAGYKYALYDTEGKIYSEAIYSISISTNSFFIA